MLGVRVLAQVLENTIYSYARRVIGLPSGRSDRGRFVSAIGPPLWVWLTAESPAGRNIGWPALSACGCCSSLKVSITAIRTALGDGRLGVWGAELAVATAVFGLPARFSWGPHSSHLVQSSRGESEGGVGKAVAFNALGCALAPPLFGVAMVGTMGAEVDIGVDCARISAVVGEDFGMAKVGAARAGRNNVRTPGKTSVGADTGWRQELLEYREGVMDSVAVIEHFDGNRSLQVNSRLIWAAPVRSTPSVVTPTSRCCCIRSPTRALSRSRNAGISLGAFSEHRNLQTGRGRTGSRGY